MLLLVQETGALDTASSFLFPPRSELGFIVLGFIMLIGIHQSPVLPSLDGRSRNPLYYHVPVCLCDDDDQKIKLAV